MPYKNIKELPQPVRSKLPEHAQEIYMASFNNAFKEYEEREKRKDPEEDQETVCHKVAWAAVKTKYAKDPKGEWRKKTDV
jgi:cation transport regulator